MTVYGTMLVLSTMEYRFTLTISGISMGIVYSIIPIAFGIMTVRLLLFTYDSIRAVLNPSGGGRRRSCLTKAPLPLSCSAGWQS